MKTIKENWQSYKDNVVPAKAGKAQILETNRGFYAGSMSTLSIILELGTLTSAEALICLENLKNECLEYVTKNKLT